MPLQNKRAAAFANSYKNGGSFTKRKNEDYLFMMFRFIASNSSWLMRPESNKSLACFNCFAITEKDNTN